MTVDLSENRLPRRKTKRGIGSIADLKARCVVDRVSHCWLWQGAVSGAGYPAIHAFCFERGDKRVMSGMRAVFGIAHDRAPLPGYIVTRCCGQALCLNPAHLRECKGHRERGLAVRRSGRLVGTNLEVRRRNVAVALAALGRTYVPPVE
jgi:hypothetical protein